MVVKYFATFRDYTHCKEEIFSVGETTVLQLLVLIGQKYGAALASQLLAEDKQHIHEDVIFLINGRNIDFLQREASKISDHDTITLFPRIAGG